MRFRVWLVGVVLALAATAPAAAAGCNGGDVNWHFGKTTRTIWFTSATSPCQSISNHPENIDRIEITERAENGLAGKNGPYGVAYVAKPGFKGTDHFVYSVVSNAHYRKGAGVVSRIEVTVEVQ